MEHERRQWLTGRLAVRATLVSASLFALPGCTEESVTGSASHALAPVLRLGEVELQIYEGPASSSGDVLAWSIGFSDVLRSEDGPDPQSMDSATVVVTFDEGSMRAADGSVECWFVGHDLVDSNGEVVLRHEDGYVYPGESQPHPQAATPPSYHFAGREILSGMQGPPLASATLNLHHAEPALRLLIAALLFGVCGGDGL